MTCEKVLSGSDITGNMNRSDIHLKYTSRIGTKRMFEYCRGVFNVGNVENNRIYIKKSGKFVVLFYKKSFNLLL